jgi:hypothetical protein
MPAFGATEFYDNPTTVQSANRKTAKAEEDLQFSVRARSGFRGSSGFFRSSGRFA